MLRWKILFEEKRFYLFPETGKVEGRTNIIISKCGIISVTFLDLCINRDLQEPFIWLDISYAISTRQGLDKNN